MAFSFQSLSQEIETMAVPSPSLSEEIDTRYLKLMGHFKDSTSLRLMAGAYSLAKEDEAKPLGEDAFFISDDERTIGVADGVGGWAEFGIDSGVYARQLMGNASHFVENHSSIDGGMDPMSVLNHAFENSSAGGASTACIITLKDNALQAVNVGDSGFLVIRGGKIVYKSPVQQSYFNCPFQLGVSSANTPSDADEIRFEVERGDVMVVATDGLFDNVFDDEVEEIVRLFLEKDAAPEETAIKLGTLARNMSLTDEVSPFTLAAVKDGRDWDEYLGGKYDDVTVVVGYIY